MSVVVAGAMARGPAWRKVGLGIRFHMRPATSIERGAAEAAARDRLKAVMSGMEAMAELGLGPVTHEQLSDPYWIIGATRWLIAVELAVRVVDGWDGPIVDEATGEMPEVSRAALADLLRYEQVQRGFETAAYSVMEGIEAEGKKSPPPPNGSAAGAAPIAGHA